MFKAAVTALLRAACRPLFDAVRRWVVDGELELEDEFFVSADPSVPDDDLWRKRYRLRPEMLPPFIPPDVAADILRIGTSINFLRRCCSDSGWDEHKPVVLAAADAAGGLGYGQPAALLALVREASSRVDRRLRQVLFDKFDFLGHCHAMKRYLLLGQVTAISAGALRHGAALRFPPARQPPSAGSAADAALRGWRAKTRRAISSRSSWT